MDGLGSKEEIIEKRISENEHNEKSEDREWTKPQGPVWQNRIV